MSKTEKQRWMELQETRSFDQKVRDEKPDELVKLELLVTSLKSNLQIALSGSPLVPTLLLLSDSLALVSQLLFSNKLSSLDVNQGLKFVEEVEVPEPVLKAHLKRKGLNYKQKDQLKQDHIVHKDNAYLDPTETKTVLDPLMKSGKSKQYKFVENQSDPLGNPLQVTIDLGSGPRFQDRDRRQLAQFFEDLSQMFVFLESGVIDWKLLKLLRQFYRPPDLGKQSNAQSLSSKTAVYHHFRRKSKLSKGTQGDRK